MANSFLKKKSTLTVVSILVAIFLLVVVVMNIKSGVKAKKEKQEQSAEKPQPTVQLVNVAEITNQVHSNQVTAFGEVTPEYRTVISSEVAGKLVFVSQALHNGKIVKKGQLLARVEPMRYQAAVARAKASLASAQVALLEEQRRSAQAVDEYKAAGFTGTPVSELVFRIPQTKAAQARVNEATFALQQAEKELRNTSIRAPFTGVLSNVNAQPQALVNMASPIATISSTSKARVQLSLTQSQWQQLPDETELLSSKQKVQVFANSQSNTQSNSQSDNQSENEAKTKVKSARVTSVSNNLDAKTRQRSLFVTINNPLHGDMKLYNGSFVKVVMNGKKQKLWQVPAKAVSQQGSIWLLDSNSCLVEYMPTVLFSKADNVYTSSLPVLLKNNDNSAEQTAKVVLSPLNNFVTGKCVEIQKNAASTGAQ